MKREVQQMSITVFFIGLFIVTIGFGYLYRPDKVSKFNAWAREYLFNDRLLILYRRKAGVMLIIIGAVIIFMSIK